MPHVISEFPPVSAENLKALHDLAKSRLPEKPDYNHDSGAYRYALGLVYQDFNGKGLTPTSESNRKWAAFNYIVSLSHSVGILSPDYKKAYELAGLPTPITANPPTPAIQ